MLEGASESRHFCSSELSTAKHKICDRTRNARRALTSRSFRKFRAQLMAILNDPSVRFFVLILDAANLKMVPRQIYNILIRNPNGS